jgi:type IV pilus assembly protein PilV
MYQTISLMIHFHPSISRTARRQSGFSMLEVLVTITITAIALLGAAGLQLRALQTGQSSQSRSQAVMLAADLAERMEGNKSAAKNGNYVFNSSSSLGTVTDCATVACSDVQMATYDVSNWKAKLQTQLPQVTSWTVTYDATAATIYTIVINWVERRTNANYDAAVTGSGEPMSYTSTRYYY